MTDTEIINALECCKNPIPMCDDCPVGSGEMCFDFLKDYALDLINRQKAEIDRFADIGKMYSEVRAEAIKDFAERLKLYLFIERGGISTVSGKDIDNLVKEMTEEQP